MLAEGSEYTNQVLTCIHARRIARLIHHASAALSAAYQPAFAARHLGDLQGQHTYVRKQAMVQAMQQQQPVLTARHLGDLRGRQTEVSEDTTEGAGRCSSSQC